MSEGTARGATLDPHILDAEEVASRLALQHLATAYCHAIDRRDYTLLATLYHEDAVDDHSPYYCGPATGYVAWLPTMMANWSATAHRIDTTLYLFDGERAEGELRATAWHRTLDGRRDFLAHGRYVDQYTRREGIWRFQKRAFILDWSEERSVTTGDDFGSDGVAVAQPSAQDPVYEFLPMMAADREARTLAT